MPDSHAFFSNFRVQRSLFSRRSLAAEGDSTLADFFLGDINDKGIIADKAVEAQERPLIFQRVAKKQALEVIKPAGY
jgi:hypothetical protein